MANAPLDALRKQFDTTNDNYQTLLTRATTEGRDLTEAEQTDANALLTRLGELGKQAEDAEKAQSHVDAAAAIFARTSPDADTSAGVTTPVASPARTNPRGVGTTAGQYVATLIRAQAQEQGWGDFPDAPRERELLIRSAAQEVSSDVAGLIPTNIVGDLVKFVDASRPAVNASRRIGMPQFGSTFLRPRVTQFTAQPDVPTDQAATPSYTEFGTFPSQEFKVTNDSVAKQFIGQTLNVSRPTVDWAQGDTMALILEDMAEQYSIGTEQRLCTAIQSAGATTTTLSLTATADATVKAISTAQAANYALSKKLPTVLFASVDRWSFLAGLTDTTGRQVFPTIAPQNAAGDLSVTTFAGSVMGLNLVVSPEFSSHFLAVAVPQYIETYEQTLGFLQIRQGNFATLVSFGSYWAQNVYAKALQYLAP